MKRRADIWSGECSNAFAKYTDMNKISNRALVAYSRILLEDSPVYLSYSFGEHSSDLRIVTKRKITAGEQLRVLSGTRATDDKTEHSQLSAVRISSLKKDFLLTGPIRFVNSDCNPNADVRDLTFAQ